ncbi:Uncharacterised protein [Achromobacter sp. 2789STDY5608633]|nr:Uncharacterised protein [Achromobacter sp. 2789STDY5608633]
MLPRQQRPPRPKQLLPQRPLRISRLVHPPFLQLRHHQIHEIRIALRRHRPRQVEAVDVRFFHPRRQFIGHLRRAAHQRRVAAAQRHVRQQIAYRAVRAGHRQVLHRRLDRVVLHVADRLVRRIARKIDAGRTGVMGQARLRVGVAQVLRVLLARLGLGAAHHRRHAHEELDIARIAALAGHRLAHARHQLAQAFLGLARHEHAFRVARREGLAAARRARLVQHRRALARRFRQVIALHLVILALVIDAPHRRRIGIDARAPVGAHRAVVPAAFPQLVGHLQELVGAVVALVVRDLFRQAHGARRALQVAGDDVPADAAIGQVVQRRKAARQQVRRLVGQVHRHAETQVAGGGGHGGDRQQRVVDRQLDRLAQRQVGRVLVHVVDADDVGQEQPVEQAALQQARQVGPVVQRLVPRRRIARMRPQAVVDVADAVHVERVQEDLLLRHGVRFRGNQVVPTRPGAASFR